ncbi:MAG: 2-polyprenylphenol 6-hydroxylase [Alphaproteobacteria bacterium]
MLRSARNILRLLQIAWTLARHDALFPLEQLRVAPGLVWLARRFASRQVKGRPGERLALACQQLGPSFIKLGQALSVRSDLVGEEIAADLARLQDRLPAFPGSVARTIIERELEQPIDRLFARFDEVPVAAASIAQVHFALTTTGEPVAVKVLRPTVEREIARDLDLMFWLAELVERTQPRLRRLRPLEVARTFEETVQIEMDFRMEAAAADELGLNFAGDAGYRTPRIDWDRTARRVLTQERVAGVRIDDREALLAAGHDPSLVLQKCAETFFFQVFRDGFFHADMHGGNAFVTPDGTVVPIDFGIMGRLARKDRVYLAELLIAFLRGDYYKVAEVQWRAGYVPPDANVEVFAQACRSIGAPIFGKPTHDISLARVLGQLFQVARTFRMEVQPQLLLLQKTMLMAEGMGLALNRQVNIWELARPLIESWMRDSFGPEAHAAEAMRDALEAARAAPRLIGSAASLVEEAAVYGLRLHPETIRTLTLALPRQRRRSMAAFLLGAASALSIVAVVIALLAWT